MPHKKRVPPAHAAPKTVWAYAYEFDPPQPEDRLRAVRALLEREHRRAAEGESTWEGRFVRENRVTHILVVTDSPDQGREVNRRLEAGLKAIAAGFAITVPLAVDEGD